MARFRVLASADRRRVKGRLPSLKDGGGRNVRSNVGGVVPCATIQAAGRLLRDEVDARGNPEPSALVDVGCFVCARAFDGVNAVRAGLSLLAAEGCRGHPSYPSPVTSLGAWSTRTTKSALLGAVMCMLGGASATAGVTSISRWSRAVPPRIPTTQHSTRQLRPSTGVMFPGFRSGLVASPRNQFPRFGAEIVPPLACVRSQASEGRGPSQSGIPKGR